MKRILSLVLVLVFVLGLAGCGNDKERELYNLNLEKYVEVGEYKGIELDTKSDDFKKVEQDLIDYDIEQYYFYKGTVKKGDVANIDYVGKKDGVAFDGGSAQGYDLEIGSGTFIPGFEEGLIGAKVGETVNLNLTFPKDYDSAELAGQDVIFTVRVNYTDKKIKQEPEEYYKKLGFEKVEDYYENVNTRAIEEALVDKVIKDSKVKDYPKKDLEKLYTYYYNTLENNIKVNYQIDMDTYFQYIQQTEEQFKDSVINNQVKPLMDQQMFWYAIFDKEEMTITEKDTEDKIKEIIAQNGDSSITKADVIEQFGNYYIENLVVSEKVFDLITKNAKIS